MSEYRRFLIEARGDEAEGYPFARVRPVASHRCPTEGCRAVVPLGIFLCHRCREGLPPVPQSPRAHQEVTRG